MLPIKNLHQSIGAEVIGVDLSKPVTDLEGREILELFHEHSLLLFRNQSIEPEQQIEFTRLFGDPAIHVLDNYLHPDHPEILVISNVIGTDGQTEGLDEANVIEWHSDFFWREHPSIGSLLYAVEVPPTGGDTLFASMYDAFERLPASTQHELEGLRARRSLDYLTENERKLNPIKPPLTDAQRAAAPPVDHPLVRIHPKTQRKSLFISQMAIEEIYGMSEEAKEDLLDRLFEHATTPSAVYRHRWKKGDLIAWDNRCTIHTVTPSERRYRRLLHRTTLAGEAVLASARGRVQG